MAREEFDKPKVNGYTYPTLTQTTEYKRFNNEYFSGADVRIYFGDIWIDEVTSLQFNLQEQVTPIFGYASYTWDKVARGVRQIEGQFSINFKESFYLHSVLNSLQSKLEGRNKGEDTLFNEEQFKQGLTIEHLVEQSYDKNFGIVADEFEKSFWGKSGDKPIQKATDSRPNDTYFYSDLNKAKGATQHLLRDNGFNIVVTYGPYNEKNGVNSAGAAVSIIGVQLTSVSQVIGGDGSPVQEMYSFIAQDLNGNVK